MKKLMTIVLALSFGGLATVARLGTPAPVAVAAGSCDGRRAVAGDGRGVLRHTSSTPSVGTTYVLDRAGGDVVVAETAAGVRRFGTRDEARNPSLSAAGALVWAQGGGLRLVSSGSITVRRVHGPVRGGVSFSPVFDADGGIVAGVAARPTRAVPEDEFLSNLWRYRRGSRTWIRMTRFSGGADRWSVVRTPFTAPDGSVEFVRVHGRAALERMPTFELWQVRGVVVSKIRTLPGEMYLAGFDGSDRLWNVRDGSTGAWRIEREQPGGDLRFVRCGAVAVDPLDRPDPDRRPGTRWATLSPKGPASAPEHSATDPGATGGETTVPVDAILVGDFSSVEGATAAAVTIRSVFGSTAEVVTSAEQPTVIRPGVWAVIVPVTSSDPEEDLGRFRAALPDLAGWSWIVSI